MSRKSWVPNVAKKVAAIRALRIAEPHMTTAQIRKRLHLRQTSCWINEIIRNEIYPDPTYKRPNVPVNKHDSRHLRSTCRSARMRRTPSIDCKYTCLTCGMGFDTETDARECCSAFAAVARGDTI